MDIFGRIRAENEQVYFNTGRIYGISSIDISPNLGLSPLNYIGIGNKQVNQILDSEQYIDVSINRTLIDYDPFIQYTGVDCFNLFILQNQGDINNAYSLISGYLNTYNLRFSVGQPIQTSASIRFINDGGKIPTGLMNANALSQLIQIPTGIYEDTERKFEVGYFGSTNLTLNEYNTQRIIDSNIDIRVTRTPIYNVGNKIPSKINIIYPIIVNASFTIEINNSYSGIELQAIPANQQLQNISFNIFSHNNPSNLIASYNFSGMNVINERYGISVDGNATVTKEFQGYIFN